MKSKHGDQFIVSHKLGLVITVKTNGYIPRSGLLLVDYFKDVDVCGHNILDIGTGETGILAQYLKARGADTVTACDLDPVAIHYAKQSSTIAPAIKWLVSDVYTNIPAIHFDIIVSNPPQMPMPCHDKMHDWGGSDGRDVILKIITGAHGYLTESGSLYLLCFDFLGVTESFGNNKPSLVEVAADYKLDYKIVATHERFLRKGGETEKSIPWISQIYPRYKFKSNNQALCHKLFVLRISKKI